jgi:hypothetical protein
MKHQWQAPAECGPADATLTDEQCHQIADHTLLSRVSAAARPDISPAFFGRLRKKRAWSRVAQAANRSGSPLYPYRTSDVGIMTEALRGRT